MKHFALLLLFNSSVNGNMLFKLRELFHASYYSKVAFDKLAVQAEKISLDDSAVLIGYKAVAETMRCRYLSSPIEKYLYFNRGKKILEMAIYKEPYNIELRYLRFCVQDNAPAFLRYKSNMEDDKMMILRYVGKKKSSGVPEDPLFAYISRYISRSNRFSDKDKKLLSAK